MDWYYGCGTNDFVVPGGQDLMASHPSQENWSKWGINAPEGYNSPKNFMSMDSNTSEAEFNFDGESFSNRVKFESSSYDKAQSSSSSVCEGLTDQSFQQTSLSRNHHHRQTNYQLQELSSSFEQTDDIFLDSILEDYPCAENLNKSFYFYPENQCSNSPGGLQRDMAASESLSCNSNSDDCLNIETLQILDHSEQFNGDESMHTQSSIEESTLQNLEAIISQFNDKTRISFRDALYRLARDTKQQHTVDDLDGDISMQEAMRSNDNQATETDTHSLYLSSELNWPSMSATDAQSSLRHAFGNVLVFFILILIGVLAFSIRLFSVIKYESVIHEFDPYFNYRVTQFLSKNGIYDFWNWFDDRTWYPLGRVIGGTVYPGLTLTAGTLWWVLNFLNIPLSVETVCVFTAPIFSAFASWATYLLTKEVKGSGAGLTAALFLAMVPSYISRSVAGSYDNEAVAIFALIFTFYLYIKTLNTGSLFYATLNSIAYFYMVCSWGGYTFIINLIPMHALLCIVTGRYSSRLYIAYAPFVILGTLLASLVPVVGFNAVMTSEHFASFLVFILIHVVALVYYIKGILSPKMFKVAVALVVSGGLAVCLAMIAVLIAMVASSPTMGWSGRSLSLLDPTYASKYIPIIASVSEHQPPTWPSYFMDINVLAFLVPAGIIACFSPLSDASSFVILYIVTSVYFSGVMVRLMLVLAPAACILSGIALSQAFDVFTRSIKFQLPSLSVDSHVDAGGASSESVVPDDTVKTDKTEDTHKERTSKKSKRKEKEPVEKPPSKSKIKKRLSVLPLETSIIAIVLLILLGAFYVVHSVWAAAEAYSAPSIVLTSHSHDGLHVFDDFREAYAWLSHNTEVDDKVASWWDYGYQTTAMANRTVIVDNNTWNNTHIATVGTAMSSPEKAAWEIFHSLDVKYVLVVFGGLVGYPSDDINKFLWMVRIGGGVFPHIKEPDYLRDGQYRIDSMATPTMLNSLMYKLSYYRFVETDGKAFDRVRRTEIGKKHFKLTHFEEVFTTHHWMVRLYKLKPPKNRIRGKTKKTKSKSTPKTVSKRKGLKRNPF